VSDTFSANGKLGQVEDGCGKIPALGLSWANAVTTRLMLSRTDRYVTLASHDTKTSSTKQQDSSVIAGTYQANVRNLRVLFAPHLPNSECHFIVDVDGVKGLPADSIG